MVEHRIQLGLLRSNVVCSALNEAGERTAVTMVARGCVSMRTFFHAAKADPLARADAAGSFFLVALLGRRGPGLRREQCRGAVATEMVLGPCVLSVQDHPTAALHLS